MTRGLTPKRVIAGILFLVGAKLERAAKWFQTKSLHLLGMPTIPVAPPVMEMAGGCLNCGSMFAVKSEFEAHVCPRRST